MNDLVCIGPTADSQDGIIESSSKRCVEFWTDRPIPVTHIGNVEFGFLGDDQGEFVHLPQSRSRTSPHGIADSGFAS